MATTPPLPQKDNSLQLQAVARRLNAWRARRQRGQRIPEDIWNSAVSLARTHGLNPTAAALKLNYYDLRRRLGIPPVRPPRFPAGSSFIELAPPSTPSRGEDNTLELVRASGSRVILRLAHANSKDLRPLVQLFLRQRS
jgi:hypothetical protein